MKTSLLWRTGRGYFFRPFGGHAFLFVRASMTSTRAMPAGVRCSSSARRESTSSSSVSTRIPIVFSFFAIR